MFYNAEKKYERLFERGSEQFSYAETMEDWRECYQWYRKHKMLKRTTFVDWVVYLLTQSVKYIHEVWEKYCSISMEEIAFGETIALA